MGDITELLAELADLHDRLIALPADAFAERHELRSRQDALRERAAEFQQHRDAGRSRTELELELSALDGQLEAIRSQRIDPVKQAGGGPHGGEMGNLGAVALNQRMREAQGVPGIQSRMAQIRARLEELDRSPE